MSTLTDIVRQPSDVTSATGVSAAVRDPVVIRLATIASLISVASTVFFFMKGDILLYKDTISHMEIARRVLSSPTAGPAQLGYVWLPLPHILMLPFVWNNTLYFDGLAGSIASMVCFVIATVLIYKIVYHLTAGNKLAGLVGAFVFMANPNILYMQSTPMTELLLFATMLGGVYGIQRWIQTKKTVYLFGGGFSLVLSTLSRYEGWVLSAMLVAVVLYTCLFSQFDWVKTKAIVIIAAATSFLGILFWMGWNVYYFGNPFDFQDGQYAKPSNWVSSADPQVGHSLVAFKTYWYAVDDNLHLLVICLAGAGLVLLLARFRFSPVAMPTLATLVFVPFFTVALDKGQRPLNVIQITGSLYNVRFGLIMAIPAAILIGYLASLFSRQSMFGLALATVLVVLAGSFTYDAFQKVDSNIITLQEPLVYATQKGGEVQRYAAAGKYLQDHYKGGLVLEQSYGNEEVLFDAKVPTSNNIYEGSYKLWQPALKDPIRSHIVWIVMSNSQADQVFTSLHNSPALKPYRLVYNHLNYKIYERK